MNIKLGLTKEVAKVSFVDLNVFYSRKSNAAGPATNDISLHDDSLVSTFTKYKW